MQNRTTQRYCADPEAIAAMKRDGMGWGHDLECGCFEAPTLAKDSRPFWQSLTKLIKRN